MENMSAIQRKTLISSAGIWFWQPNIEFFFNMDEDEPLKPPLTKVQGVRVTPRKAAESMGKGTIGAFLNHNLPGEICLPVLGQPKSR